MLEENEDGCVRNGCLFILVLIFMLVDWSIRILKLHSKFCFCMSKIGEFYSFGQMCFSVWQA